MTVQVTVTIYSTIIILMLVYSCDIKRNMFLQINCNNSTKKKEHAQAGSKAFEESNINRGVAKCSIRGTNNQLPNRYYEFSHLEMFNVTYKFAHLQLLDDVQSLFTKKKKNSQAEENGCL